MRFEELLQQVEKAEARVELRLTRSQASWRTLKHVWRESWTPARILAVGLAGGFLFGKAKPMRAVGAVSATRWIQMATSVSGLLASLKASQAAESAEAAATDAGEAAADATGTVEAVAAGATPEVAAAAQLADTPRAGRAPGASAAAAAEAVAARPLPDARRRPDQAFESEPRPAEAATELSER